MCRICTLLYLNIQNLHIRIDGNVQIKVFVSEKTNSGTVAVPLFCVEVTDIRRGVTLAYHGKEWYTAFIRFYTDGRRSQ